MNTVKTVTTNSGNVDMFGKGTGSRTIKLRDLVKEYLLDANLKYGEAVDTFDVMRDFGIEITDEVMNNGRLYMQYFNLAKAIGSEMVEHLNLFGFKADKKVKPKYEGFDNSIHINGNVVYTNYPWTVVSKAIAATVESSNAMKGIHDSGVDLSIWEENYPDQVRTWKAIQEEKTRFANEELASWREDVFNPMAMPLQEYIQEHFEEMAATARGRQPENYGRYPA
jgi:hypothetical protein